MKMQRYPKYIKFLLYVLVVVLANVAGRTLFARVDLTRSGIYSLSGVSRQVAASLKEPLTIKVFFTQDLPAPHNNTELYLQDLLKEYALHSNKYFNYRFYNVSPEIEGISDAARNNREMARDYGINPVQIQILENDEVKFKQAYMGLVIIHGDIIERIPTLASTDGLEYKLTTAIQKLNNKVSALLQVKDKIQVYLAVSDSMSKILPYTGIKNLETYPAKVKEVVDKLNPKFYDKLAFEQIDPLSETDKARELNKSGLNYIMWNAMPEINLEPGKGLYSLLLQYQDKVREIPLFKMIRIPLLGTQYQLAELEEIEEAVNLNVERLININEDLGYLADFGTLNTQSLGTMGPRDGNTLNSFNTLVGSVYTLKPVNLREKGIPEGLKTLVIANPTEEFSDYDLYQIDQALMRGTNLAIFTGAFKENSPPGQQMMMQQMPSYMPFDSGLGKLLAHYGIRIKQSMVMDENCFRQRLPQAYGGGEQPLYFAPIIRPEQMNKELDFIRDIKGLVTLQASPLELVDERIKAQNVKAHELFASSPKSWEMRDRIMLNPMFITPPAADEEKGSRPLAYLLEGSFGSYFKDKPVPEKPAEKPEEETEEASLETDQPQAEDLKPPAAETQTAKLQGLENPQATVGQSPPARVFITGSAEMLKDQLLDEEGQSTNAMFVLNILDALNGHEAIAAMRSKQQRYNPLNQMEALHKTAVKWINIIGAPVLVVGFGLLVWARRTTRRRTIQMLFQDSVEV